MRKTGKPSHQDSGWCVWVKQSNSVTKYFNGLVSGFLLLAVACSDHALEFSLVTVFVFMSICFIALIIVHCYNSEVNILGRISAAQAAIFIRFLCFYALCLSPNTYVTMQPR